MRKKRLVKAYKSARAIAKSPKPIYSRKFYFLISVGVFLVLSISVTNMFWSRDNNALKTNEVLAESRDIYHERDFWIKLLETTPDYIPGLCELSKIEVELGNMDLANELLAKAKFINPNDERVKETEEAVGSAK